MCIYMYCSKVAYETIDRMQTQTGIDSKQGSCTIIIILLNELNK